MTCRFKLTWILRIATVEVREGPALAMAFRTFVMGKSVLSSDTCTTPVYASAVRPCFSVRTTEALRHALCTVAVRSELHASAR